MNNIKRDLKNKHKRMFSELTEIVNRNDPAGLIRLDFPDDEYCFEVNDIPTGLRKCNSIDDTCKLVASVFNEAFNDEFESYKYLDLAEPVWEWWKKQINKKDT